jgi:dTMP kinase
VQWATGGIEPDLTILLDVSPSRARGRLDLGRADRLERLDAGFHERVREGYRALAAADPDSWVVVDADADVERVAEQLLAVVVERLGPLPPVASSPAP